MAPSPGLSPAIWIAEPRFQPPPGGPPAAPSARLPSSASRRQHVGKGSVVMVTLLGIGAGNVSYAESPGWGIPQTLNIAGMLLSIMVATTATAKLRENENFNCIKIMGNQFYCKYFH